MKSLGSHILEMTRILQIVKEMKHIREKRDQRESKYDTRFYAV